MRAPTAMESEKPMDAPHPAKVVSWYKSLHVGATVLVVLAPPSTMYRLVVLLSLAALSGAQFNRDPQTAAILMEQRFLQGDGSFGAQYSQEDGVEFKEESDENGNRRGSYSYVDPNGQRHTVSYTAGKDGFNVQGADIPVPPNPPPQAAPQPQYRPLPQYNPPDYTPPQSQYQPQPQARPQYRQEQYQPQPQYNPPPQQYNPPSQQYNAPQQYNPPPQQQQQYNYQPQQNAIPQYRTTTPPPHRFYPPGKLDLSRTPDGFSYTFNKS